jgi:hypothetical protein
MSENEVQRKVFGPKGDKINSGEDYIRRSFHGLYC